MVYINILNLLTSDIGVHVGQNAALRGDVNWNAVVELWHSEKTNFVFGSGPITPGAPYEHHTQVGNAILQRVVVKIFKSNM